MHIRIFCMPLVLQPLVRMEFSLGRNGVRPISTFQFKVTQSIKITTMALQHEGTRNTIFTKVLLNSIFLADLIRIEHNQC